MTGNRTTEYLLSRHGLPTAASTPPYSDGVPLQSQEIESISEYKWPTHAAVPWPEGTVHGRYFRLGIFEDNVEVPSQEIDAQTWDMHGVDLRWSHVHFVWNKGKQYTVRSMSRAIPVPSPAYPINVTDSVSTITVETGKIKAVINKDGFALFDEVHFDSTGNGRYTNQILSGSSGPEILENGKTFATRFDTNATVEVEIEGPLYVVIKAEGVYQASGEIGSDWANFTTHIHFWAGQDWIRVVHNLGYRESMATHEYDRAVIVMPFNFAERFAFAADGSGDVHKDDFSNYDGADLYLHQEKHDTYRFGTHDNLIAQRPDARGTRSNSSWAIQGSAHKVRVECYLRNGWQEFPFEAKVGRSEMGISMQPWHGYETFDALDSEMHTGEGHIHKLRYAHTGEQQRQGLPTEYVNAFNTIDSARRQSEMFETNANDAASANWQGMMLRQDFYLRVVRDTASSVTAFDTSNLVDYAKLVQNRPIATPGPSHVQESFVFGPIGTVKDGYAEIFDYVTDIIKGDYNAERGEYYGRFRWGALPHIWNIDENRPHWHRLEYGDSHYDRIALIFWYYMATGDNALLQIARRAVKFHQCFRYINYASSVAVPDHGLMLQWHKGLTPCAGLSTDDATSHTGHTVHAYAMLVGWLIDADLDVRDGYRRWSNNAHHHTLSRDRNTNNNLHEAIQQYEFFHDRQMKDVIKAMTSSLISEPMSVPVVADRNWDRAWPLYLDLFGGEGVREFFETEATPAEWLYSQNGNFAHMALCYRVTGDKTFLERALKPLRSLNLRDIFRTNTGPYSPAFFYNIYGQPEVHKTLLHFLYYLKQAGITEIPEDDGEPGQYPIGSAVYNNSADVKARGIWIPIHNPTGNSFTLQLRVGTVAGGSLDAVGIFLYDPAGTELLQALAPDVTIYQEGDGTKQVRESGWVEFLREVTIPAGPGGRYDLYMGTHEAGQFLPTTAEGLLECAVIRNAYRQGTQTKERRYHASLTRMYLLPKTTSYEIEWTFTPWHSRQGCRIRVYDANDVSILDKYLLRNTSGYESATVRMNSADAHPTPWRIDCGSTYVIEAASVSAFDNNVQNLALLGPTLSDLQIMEPLIPLS
ncbi:MAG: hypothetical protein O7E52_25305 [Candidatus Poribacteria bacterium]|nr:hypothetical protein [Candidatus Poribacteria bacterium]